MEGPTLGVSPVSVTMGLLMLCLHLEDPSITMSICKALLKQTKSPFSPASCFPLGPSRCYQEVIHAVEEGSSPPTLSVPWQGVLCCERDFL